MLIDDYFQHQIKYEKKYGKKTIVLMEVGSFFEFYGVSNEKEQIGNAKRVCELLNIQLTRRNKAINENSRKNALMAGFPTHSMKRFMNVLLENNYTIVLIEQTTPPPNPMREITKIISPGTYIDEVKNNEANYITSVLIKEEKCYKTNIPQYIIGLASIDLTTGKNSIYELYSTKNDEKVLFEEMYRYIESFCPKEIIIIGYQLNTLTKDKILMHINTSNRKYHYIDKIDPSYSTISYQNEFLNRVFTNSVMLSPIEYLNLERTPSTTISYIYLLQFAYEHDQKVIQKIEKPEIWKQNSHMILYNNSIYQLNIIPYSNDKSHQQKYNSLFDVIKFTETPMGTRQLKYNLLNPIVNQEILEDRYKKIEIFLKDDRYREVHQYLKDINDIERLHRKMALNTLHPHEFYSLDFSYKNILNIIEKIKDLKEIFDIDQYKINNFKESISNYNKIFLIDELSKNSLSNIYSSFFRKGYDKKLDNTVKNINDSKENLNKIARSLSNLIEKNSDFVKVENTEKEGYYLQCTKKRKDVLIKEYNKKESDKFEGNFNIKNFTSYVKIRSYEIDKLSNTIISNNERLKHMVKSLYITTIQKIYNNFGDIFKYITKLITNIDLISSHCICSTTYNYVKPEIIKNNNSFIEAKKLRHPIIERLHTETSYIPNDITIGKDHQGILLYGVNGVGKSALSKAVGLNVVLAQMGMYVPSKEFQYYPYENIFTRISGEDNIFKGQSSFVVEMNELRSILKYSTNRSLVLGDEVCKGTEDSSATALVSSAIKRFSKNKVNFIFATHLHKLYELDSIKEINNVKFMHLDIKYDEKLNEIIYGRKLKEGIGESIYGIEIAKYILDDNEFIKNATETRNLLLRKNSEILNNKKSIYNKDIYLNECQICKKNKNETSLDVHHILFQKDFDMNDNIEHIKKDNINNLVVLCKDHHNDVHNNKLKIYGYDKTLEGKRVLKYEFVEEKKKKFKYEYLVNFIESNYYKEYNNKIIKLSFIKNDIFLKKNIKISDNTLRKILNKKYLIDS